MSTRPENREAVENVKQLMEAITMISQIWDKEDYIMMTFVHNNSWGVARTFKSRERFDAE